MSGYAVDFSRVIPLTRLPAVRWASVGDSFSSLASGQVSQTGQAAGTTSAMTGDWSLGVSLADHLGPPLSGTPSADNDVSHLRAEIRVGDRVIGRVYNSGGVELADGYAYLGDLAGFGGAGEGSTIGPDLADMRINKLASLLKADVVSADKATNADSIGRFGASVVMANTAVSQAEWLAEKAAMPGSILSKEA